MKIFLFVFLAAITIEIAFPANIAHKPLSDDVIDDVMYSHNANQVKKKHASVDSDVNGKPRALNRDVINTHTGQQDDKVQQSVHRDVISESRAPVRDVIKDSTHTGSALEMSPDTAVLEVIDGDKLELSSTTDITTDVLSKIDKRFEKKNKKRKMKWSKGAFTKALKDLGVFTLKGLKVVKLKKENITELRKMKNCTKVIRAESPRVRDQPNIKADESLANENENSPSNQNADISKRKAGYDLCEEYVDSMFVLAHEDASLAYEVESVRCKGKCHSALFKYDLGSCNLATKAMIVYRINSVGKFIPQTITPGCACECLHYNQ